MNLFSKRVRNSLKNIKSPIKDLEFKTLKIYYEEKGYEINDNFLKKLDLYTNHNEFNYIAYLLSDNNHVSVQFAKYSGTDVYDLIENEDYGFKSLIKITNNILNKIMLENKTYTKLGGPRRKEIKMYDYNAIRELVINALVHNEWTNGYSPKFEIFKDKLVISSNGGIQEGVSQDEFLKGFTNPRNPELMRVFRDLEFVEQLGTGIQRVLKVYDKSIFEFYPNHIRVTIPFNDNTLNSKKNEEFVENNSLSKIQNSILQLIQTKPTITQDEIAQILEVTRRTVIRNFKVLLDEKCIERAGTNKKGYWKILK